LLTFSAVWHSLVCLNARLKQLGKMRRSSGFNSSNSNSSSSNSHGNSQGNSHGNSHGNR